MDREQSRMYTEIDSTKPFSISCLARVSGDGIDLQSFCVRVAKYPASPSTTPDLSVGLSDSESQKKKGFFRHVSTKYTSID